MAHIAIDARLINSSTGTYTERLLHYLERLDTTNKYTVIVPTKDLEYWKPTNPNFSVVAGDFADFSLNEQIGFKKLLDAINADVVHFCMPEQPILFTGKKVTTFHDLILLRATGSDKKRLVFKAKQLVGQLAFRRIARSSDAIITPTNWVRDDVVKTLGVSPDKVLVTSEAADMKPLGELRPYEHPYKQFIMYVGRQQDHKNIRRLASAHQKLLAKYPDLGLILVGGLNKASTSNKDYFDSLGYKNITFTGFLPDEQRDWLYKNADAYVFPSLMEGFGLPGLEAMNYGTPVVSSNATCLPEVYGDAAHYFDPLNIDDMTRAIGDVLSDTKLRLELSKKGLEQVKKYSWQSVAAKTLAVYQRVLIEK